MAAERIEMDASDIVLFLAIVKNDGTFPKEENKNLLFICPDDRTPTGFD